MQVTEDISQMTINQEINIKFVQHQQFVYQQRGANSEYRK